MKNEGNIKYTVGVVLPIYCMGYATPRAQERLMLHAPPSKMEYKENRE